MSSCVILLVLCLSAIRNGYPQESNNDEDITEMMTKDDPDYGINFDKLSPNDFYVKHMNGFNTFEEICKPSQWTAWSPCEGHCDKDKHGYKSRSRTLESCVIQEDTKICDLMCDNTNQLVQLEENAECLYTEWSAWDLCDSNCVKVRLRKANHERCTHVKETEDCSICVRKPAEPIDAMAEINEMEEAMQEEEGDMKASKNSTQKLSLEKGQLLLNTNTGMKTGVVIDDISVSDKDTESLDDDDDDDINGDISLRDDKDYLDDKLFFSTFDEDLMNRNLGETPVSKKVNKEKVINAPKHDRKSESDREFWEEFRKFKVLQRTLRSKKPGDTPSSDGSFKLPWMEQVEALPPDKANPSELYGDTEECISTSWTKCCFGVEFKFKYECFPRIIKQKCTVQENCWECQYGEWSSWKMCDGCTSRYRLRNIVQGGKNCSKVMETEEP